MLGIVIFSWIVVKIVSSGKLKLTPMCIAISCSADFGTFAVGGVTEVHTFLLMLSIGEGLEMYKTRETSTEIWYLV